MKPKLLLCLALVLSGGLFGCSTTARRADGTATNAPLQIRFIEPWTNITIKLVVPGSSGLNATQSKTVEIQARQAVYEIVQNLGSRTEPILGEQYLLVVHDPFTKKFCFVEGKLDFYVSDRSGMKGYGYNSGTIDPSGVSIEFADSKLDYNSAIVQFKKNIDVQKMADLEIWGELEYDVAMTPKPMDEQKKDEMQSKAEQMISKTINFGNAFDSFDLSDEHPPVIEGVDITDGIMRLDFRETASTKRPASVWIDLKTKKAIRCLEDGQEMRLGRDGKSAIPFKSLKALQNRAANGDDEAMFQLGSLYEPYDPILDDSGVDLAEAERWYRKAADLGNTQAMMAMGNLYWKEMPSSEWDRTTSYDKDSGKQIAPRSSPNFNEGMKWFQKAAKAGDVIAETRLQEFIQINNPSALQDKADNGDADAMFQIGLIYENGDGVKANLNEAKQWFQKAADLGNIQAMTSLGELYLNKKWIFESGVFDPETGWLYRPTDNPYGPGYDKSVEWFQRATMLGDTNAANRVKVLLDLPARK